MKQSVVCAVILLLASSTTVLAAGPYVGASVGLSLIYHENAGKQLFGSSDAAGGGWNASLGYDFDTFRVEGEYGYKYVSYILASGKVVSYMVNGYYDFKNVGSNFKPFLGAGMGIVKGEVESEGYVADDSSLAVQASFGVGYHITQKLIGSFYYRFERAVMSFSGQWGNIPYGSNNFMAGLRYNF